MLISIDWIKDFVEIDKGLSPHELSQKVTLGTAEVESISTVGGYWRKVVIGKITHIEKHPSADQLNLVTFEINSEGESKRVVCGGVNVRTGLKVAFAPVGTKLPNGLLLEPKKIRGVVSEGMLCSEEELGLPSKDPSQKGIWELPDEAPLGANLSEYLNIKEDQVLEIDNKSLTHRPDLWGHYGFARELAALYDRPLRPCFGPEGIDTLNSYFTPGPSPLVPQVAPESCCVGYFGLSIDGVTVGESPDWMKQRLEACGLRSINNIVDISNYVMLELGGPNHIFDRDLIEGNTISVVKLKEKQKFATLDEVERELEAGDTVVADAARTLVIGGIMGGQGTSVTEKTKNIFLEVANWHPGEIRKTSTRLGLRTDSSQRFEKSLDIYQCTKTMYRLMELVLQLCPGAVVVGKMEYDGKDLSNYRPVEIPVSSDSISKVLGVPLTSERIKSILEGLEFKVTDTLENGRLSVEVPSFRATKDVECAADIAEEVGRMIGYDNITPAPPLWELSAAKLTNAQRLHRRCRDFLSLSANALEVMTYPLVGADLLKKASWPALNDELKLLNALSDDSDRMRPSLIPQSLDVLAQNQKHYSDFGFFELGRSYLPGKGDEFSEERSHLLIGRFCQKSSPFIQMANSVEQLLSFLKLPASLRPAMEKFPNQLVPANWPGVHPLERLDVMIMGKVCGAITSIHPLILKKFKVKGSAAIAVIDLSEVENRPIKQKSHYAPLPKFPSSRFDCTVEVPAQTSVGIVLKVLAKIKIKELKERKIVAVFPMEEGKKAVTLMTKFFDPEKTLSGELLKEAQEKIVFELEKAGFPLKKG